MNSSNAPKSILSKHARSGMAISSLILLVACSQNKADESGVSAEVTVESRRIAEARLSPTDGNTAEGVVTFVEEPGGIRVIADVRNLSVNGSHGFHIHENGDCSAADASSAGGHFNPTGHAHAGPKDDERHVGDLGNLETTDAGSSMYLRLDKLLSFDGNKSIIGRSVVVHAERDDYASQPSGAAGERVACGVIQWLNEVSQ